MRKVLLVTALALCASVAQADDGLFYVGVGGTSNNFGGISSPYTSFNYVLGFSHTSFKVFAGIHPIKLFAVEVEYLNLGSGGQTPAGFHPCGGFYGPCAVSENSGGRAYAGYALGFLPITLPYNLEVYGKAGGAREQVYDSITYSDGSWGPAGSFKSTVFTWGLGVQAHVGIIGARFEYEHLNLADTRVYSLSVFLNL